MNEYSEIKSLETLIIKNFYVRNSIIESRFLNIAEITNYIDIYDLGIIKSNVSE